MRLYKKITKFIFVLLMIASSIFNMPQITKAASVNWDSSIDTGYHYGTAGEIKKLRVNGEDSFCVEWDKSVTTTDGYSESPYSKVFTNAQWQELVRIAHVGYNKEKDTLADFAATQVYIWQTTRKFDGYSMNFSESNNIPNFQTKINSIKDDLANLNDIETKNVSFKGQTKNIKVGETISISDTNGILSKGKFIIQSASTGITAKIIGNKLEITASANAPENSSVVVSIPDVNKISGNTLFYHPSSQNVSHLGFVDPGFAILNLTVEKYGSLKITKQDEGGNKIPNTSFKLSPNADMSNALGTYTTGADGTVTINDLTPATYYVQESSVPSPLILDKTIKKVTIKSNETTTFAANNKWARGSLNITKQDSVTGETAQGEATLKGAVYGLYARNAILHPGDKSVVYAKGAEVARLTTDAAAKASIGNLYLGDYYLKEITPSSGYTLDATEYDAPLTYKDQNTSVITKSQTVKERVVSQAFSIIKISDNGSGESDLLKGIEFTIKAQKDVDKAGSWEKAPIAKNAQGKPSALLITDEKGYAVSDRLPYGSYVVRETKGTDEHYLVPDFKVVVNKDSSEPQTWRVLNDEKFRAVIRIEKRDQETGNIIKIAGAKFKIKNLRTDKYVQQLVNSPVPHYVDTWTTTENGIIYTDDVIDPGEYQLEEVAAPSGYLLNGDPIKFVIKNTGVYETLPDGTTPVITISKDDKSVKGKITVSKEGEVLVSADKSMKGVKFNYETRKLAGAVFDVYANEDIYSADNNGTKIYSKGDLVETLTTLSDGTATTKELPLGKYTVKEKTAPNGFVCSDEAVEVALKYKDQDTAIIFENFSIIDDRQKVKVETKKLDVETQQGVAGAEITLYVNRDIYNYDGEIIVDAGTMLETVKTGKTGQAIFAADLPNDLTPEYGTMPAEETDETDPEFSQTVINGVRLIGDPNGLFYVTETKAPEGYTTGIKTQQYFDTFYTSQDTAFLDFAFEFQNEPTKMKFSKIGETGTEELEGAKLQVIDKATGKLIDEWISGKEGHDIKYLIEGNEYRMCEIKAPYGYEVAEEITFIAGDGKTVTMKDKMIRSFIDVQKVDYYNRNDILKIAEFTLYTDPECKNAVRKVNTDPKTGIARFDDLIYGTWYIKETKAPAGYQLSSEVVKVVIDDKWVQGDAKLRTIIYPDKPLPGGAKGVKTGDTTNTTMLLTCLGVGILGMTFSIRKRKKAQNK